MSNWKLAGLSALIIGMLAGIPHLVATRSDSASLENRDLYITSEDVDRNRLPRTRDVEVTTATELSGLWKAAYTSDEFTGNMIVEIRNEDTSWAGYVVEYTDAYGNSLAAEDKILEITGKKGKKWKIIYTMTYEGETYRMPGHIVLISETKLKLTYDLEGYGDTEVWTKVTD